MRILKSSGRRKKRFSGAEKLEEDMTLQITSMADIFTIILVFLLKSFSVSLTSVSPSPNMILPEAHAEDQAQDGLKIEVTKDGVLFEDKVVAKLNNFRFTGSEDGIRDALKGVAKDKQAPILIVSDQNTPYSTLKTVMASAADSGFANFKLLVVEDQ